MDNSIRHQGIIEAIEGHCVRVRIVQTSACGGCKVAAHCHTAESKEKIVNVQHVTDISKWHIGDEVVVSTATSMATKALLIGFGLPLVMMLIVFIIAMVAGCSEGIGALLMLGSLIPYYIIIWFYRHHIAREIFFHIEE